MARAFDDGSSQFLQNTSIVIAPPFTLAGWANTDDDTIAEAIVTIGRQASTPFCRIYIAGNVAGDFVAFSASVTGTFAAATTVGISTNTWHHACGVAAATDDYSVYIDGGSKGTATDSVTGWDMDSAGIGAISRLTPGNYFSGNIAESAIWNAALTDAEVAILALGYSPLFVRPASLVAYWPLIGRTSPEIDIVGGYDMTLNAGPTWAAHPRVIYPSRPSIALPVSTSPIGQKFILPPFRPLIS